MPRPAPRTALRPAPRSPRARSLAGWPLVAATGSACAVAPARSRRPSNVVTPGNFTGYGFDQCVAPTQSAMDAWLKQLTVPRGRHLHLRRLPRLPHPAQPDLHLGRRPARRAAGGCCPSPSVRRPRASRASRATGRLRDLPPGTTGGYATAAAQGARRGRQERRRRRDAAASARAARSGTTSRASTSQHRLPRVRPGLPPRWITRIHALGYVSGVYSSASSGIRCSTTPGSTGPTQFDLPDQIWIARWDGAAEHLHVVHPRGRLAPPRPGQAVPGRPRRDVGRRARSTSTATSSTSGAARSSRPRRTARASGQLPEVPARSTADQRDQARTPRRSRRCSACSRAGVYAGKINGVTTPHDRRRNAWQTARLRGHADLWSQATGCRCSSDGDRARS